jgi:hypothetical protein
VHEDAGVVLSCQYRNFATFADMKRISQHFQLCQNLWYIADIVKWHGGDGCIKKAWTISDNPRLLAYQDIEDDTRRVHH